MVCGVAEAVFRWLEPASPPNRLESPRALDSCGSLHSSLAPLRE